jgi:uncharacterized membrane protein YfcA
MLFKSNLPQKIKIRGNAIRMWEILLPSLGFLIGVVAAMTGVGGGIFIVPLLTLFFAFAPANAVGTSLAAIILTAFAATLNYSKQKKVCYKIGLLMAVVTAPGAVLGAYLTSLMPAEILGLFFGVFLLVVAVQITIKNGILNKSKENKTEGNFKASFEKELFIRRRKFMIGIPLIFLGGVASGLFGVGGGVIIVPILIVFFYVPIHFAVATSMFAMIFTSLSGVGQHALLGNINLEFSLLIGLGSIFGALVGAQICKRISGKNLRNIFGIILIVVALQMIIKFL